jgi:hypothetical protein
MSDHEQQQEQDRLVAMSDAATIKRLSARRTRRSFVVGGAAAAAGYGLWYWIDNSEPIGRIQGVLRRTLQANAAINRAVWGERGLAPEYPISRANPLRMNGVVGMEATLDLASWRLQLAGVDAPERSPLYAKDVTAWEYKYLGDMQPDQQSLDVKSAPKSEGHVDPDDAPPPVDPPPAAASAASAPTSELNPNGAVDSPGGAALAAHIQAMMKRQQKKRNVGNAEAGPSYSSLDIGTPGLLLAMSDLQKLPKVEFCTEFKCIEGWSQITQWGGYRLRDLMEMYPPAKINGRDPRFVYMETPDGNYYGGYDFKAARHPQSLLVTEMSGQPLTQGHGAPLRLHMPIKYGYKQIKRIGLIAYTDVRPDDFWTKLGYDWYAGL